MAIRPTFKTIFLAVFCWLVLQQPTLGQTPEVRGVWLTDVDSDLLTSRASIEEGMRFLADRGFNVVYPVVWNGGVTLYPSPTLNAVISIDRDPVIGTRDVLQEVLVEAHRHGLEVIPWMEYGFASSFGQDGGALLAAKPDWAARDVIGVKVERNGFFWMSALNPEVQQFILDLTSEILAYDVDGVQGDDRLPALPVEGGYSSEALFAYRNAHGGNEPPPDNRDADFVQWRSDRLTEFASRWHEHIKAESANLKVVFSPSVWPWGRDNYLQDWPEWLARGAGDIIHPQLYPPPPRAVDAYTALVENMVGTVPGDFVGYIPPDLREGLFPGLLIKAGADVVGADRVLPMMAHHRALGLHGEAFFFYEGLRLENNALGDALAASIYAQPAQLPGRSGIWRPRAPIAHPQVISGTWTDLGAIGPDGSRVLTAGHGSGSVVTYQVSVPADATYDLYMFAPTADPSVTSDNAGFRVFGQTETITTLDQRTAATDRWLHVASVPLSAGTTTVELGVPATADARRVVAGAMIALLNRRESPNALIEAHPTSTDRIGPDVPVKFDLFPNPASNQIMIRGANVDIFDSLGRRVISEVSGRIDTSDWAPGLYAARSTDNARAAIRMFVILR